MPAPAQPGPANAPGEFDLFISYAHRDGIDGIVPALHEQLESDFQRLLQRHVAIFLDRSDIRDFDDWKVRCHRALRASRFFIVLLSPAYLVRDACRWEWEEWIKRELEHGQVGTGAACLWFIEIASFDAPGDAERLRLWKNELRQRFGVAFHAWREGGREALQDTAARTELARLTDHVAQRLRLLALDRGQRGNLGWPQDRFVGREPELRQLRERLLDAAPSAPVALIGIGGIGKTALALTFAFREADAFPGGRWLLRCEGHARLDSAVRPLVQDLGLELAEREKLDDTLAARRVLDTLRPRGPALFLLDNVDTPALLAPDSLALLSGESGIRLLVTTRLAPGAFAAAGASVTAIDLDQLPEAHALDLIRLHQPDAAFASAADENDAREIVRALGGLTLAVETAAVYLGQNDPRVAEPRYAVRIADYLADLRRDIASPGSAMSQLREVAATIRPTLARLDAPTRTVLQLAALLPPDSLPLPWLRAVAGKFHPSLATDADIAERDAWTDLIRALIGMRLLHQKGETPVLTIHRLLQRVLDTELREQRDGLAATLDTHLGQRADSVRRSQDSPADWELDALLVALPARLGQNPVHLLAYPALLLTERISAYRTVPATAGFHAAVHEVLAKLARSDLANYEWQNILWASYIKRGDLAMKQGDMEGAKGAYLPCKAIAEVLAAINPANTGWQFDLGASNERLGNLAIVQGKLDEAKAFHTARTDIITLLVANDPTNSEWLHDLWVAQINLGDIITSQGDLGGAWRIFSESKTIAERLAAGAPANPRWQSDLGTSNQRLGSLASLQGRLAEAKAFHTTHYDIFKHLSTSDPTNLEWQNDLATSLTRLGGIAQVQGDQASAWRAFTDAKEITERLAANDPSDANLQRSLWVENGKLGDLASAQGKVEDARRSWTKAKEIIQSLATKAPANAEWQRDVAVSLSRLAELTQAQGNFSEALRQFAEQYRFVARLATSDPSNADLQRDLSVALSRMVEVACSQGDFVSAQRHHAEAQAIAERLASKDPSNAEWQRDLGSSYVQGANLAAKVGRPTEAASYFAQCHLTLRRMHESHMHLDPTLAGILTKLEQAATDNYARLIAGAASASPPPAQRIIIPDPKTQPRRELSTGEIRESARFNFGKGYWEAAAMDLQMLLARGDPLDDIAPKIVTCLLNAHENLMAHDADVIEDLLRRLESAGHPTPAANLRRPLEAKQPKPKKPWWRFW